MDFLCLKNIVDVLIARAAESAKKPAFSFFDGNEESDCLSFAELGKRVDLLSLALAKLAAPGSRAVLAYGAGLDFVVAFFASMRAGLIPVPVHSSRKLENFRRIEGIISDCGAELFLSNQDGLSRLSSLLAESPIAAGCALVSTDSLLERLLHSGGEQVDLGDRIQVVAFLQYTSGSTGDPKGVQVTHQSIMANLKAINQCFELSEETIHVSWLPTYHDMGLIGSVLSPIYAGCHSYLMAPQTFLARPLKWLETISKLKATVAGGPNFAYELCATKAAVSGIEGLDLSSWRVAYTGGEPVRASTLARFNAAFMGVGFDKDAFLPCYGMAETTLLVAGQKLGVGPKFERFNGVDLVACGSVIEGHQMLIVDEQSGQPCREGELGEIWVRGECIANGYWGAAAQDRGAFAGYTSNGDGPFLRTGDLGILKNGELYPASRSKDMLIFDGENFFPQDIEHTVEFANDRLYRGGSCVFSVDVNDRERLFVVSEISGSISESPEDLKNKEVFDQVASMVRKVHGLEVHEIVLLRTGSLPRTSSGKLRRRATRAALQDGALRVKVRWANPYKSGEFISRPGGALGATAAPTSSDEIAGWMIEWIASNLGLDYSAIDTVQSFATIKGMDSLAAVELAASLGERFGVVVNATMAWDYPTVQALSSHLYAVIDSGGVPTSPSQETAAGYQSADDTRPTADDLHAILAACERLSDAELEELLQGVVADAEG